MKWHKLGLLYTPDSSVWWSRNLYAFNPTASVAGDLVRVYFASLDEENRGRVGFVELDATDPRIILNVTREPVLELGSLGAFDDSGVNPSCVIDVAGREYLYYIGWQRSERVPYMLFSGLALREAGDQNFRRHSPVPVLDRAALEPYSRSALCVLAEDGRFRAWYWSCESWTSEGEWLHYNTVIRHAESANGIDWKASDTVCIRPTGPDEYALGRPWVIRHAGGFQMWYSIRSRARISYRIGYAESADGISWTRKDEEAGIAPSASGWDSEMICHPCVVDVNGRRYMFYNGNRHGLTGFGCAELERD
jgi:predicted GH43/DUF377 family glycosyl hydrolase